MAQWQYTFKDFLREKGEDSLIGDDPVVTGNILREIKMGLSAMAVLTVLVVVLFHEGNSGKENKRLSGSREGSAPCAEKMRLTVRAATGREGNTLRGNTSNQTAANRSASYRAGRFGPASPPAPATQDRRSGEDVLSQAGPATPAETEGVYKVAPGDTLGAIAVRLYGSSSYWQKLAAYNRISDPRKLRSGQKLKIPPLKVLKTIPTGSVMDDAMPLPPPVEIRRPPQVKSRRIPCI